MQEIPFCEELRSLLLDGATIISKYNSSHYTTIAVRMPKGQHIKKDDGSTWEYVVFNWDKVISPEIGLYIATYRNGTLREVRKRVQDGHYKDNQSSSAASDRMKKGGEKPLKTAQLYVNVAKEPLAIFRALEGMAEAFNKFETRKGQAGSWSDKYIRAADDVIKTVA